MHSICTFPYACGTASSAVLMHIHHETHQLALKKSNIAKLNRGGFWLVAYFEISHSKLCNHGDITLWHEIYFNVAQSESKSFLYVLLATSHGD